MLPARHRARNAPARGARPPTCFPALRAAHAPSLATGLKHGVDCGISVYERGRGARLPVRQATRLCPTVGEIVGVRGKAALALPQWGRGSVRVAG